MNILFVAPHPDDETLGCGGTALRHKSENDMINWLVVTKIKKNKFNETKILKRENEIRKVAKMYDFKNVIKLNYITSTLDSIKKQKIIEKIKKVLDKLKPNIIYLPFENDVHSDHKITFESVMACSKSFRAPYIKSIRVYETISETDFANTYNNKTFQPNLWVDITPYLEKKIKIMEVYKSEISKHPFPRSSKNIKALAINRGATAGFKYAECFHIIKELK